MVEDGAHALVHWFTVGRSWSHAKQDSAVEEKGLSEHR